MTQSVMVHYYSRSAEMTFEKKGGNDDENGLSLLKAVY